MKDIVEDVMLEDLVEELPKPILIEDLGTMFATEGNKHKRRFGLYKCGFCGTKFKANTYDIKSKNIKSCGCYQKRRTSESNKTHGLGDTRLYNIWANMKDRILNPKHKNYNDYGGRGINICEDWLDIRNFYNWAMENGYEENKGLSIDRIDNDGSYCPENCRWTTRVIQGRNQRMQKNNTSGFKGVCYYKKNNKYVSYIKVNRKRIHLGYFPTAVEGAIAYNNYIIKNNLEGFILNEIPQEYLEKEKL